MLPVAVTGEAGRGAIRVRAIEDHFVFLAYHQHPQSLGWAGEEKYVPAV